MAAPGDPNAGNNSATDSDSIIPALPALNVLDNFNRANANTLGSNWSQANTSLRVNNNQAFGNSAGEATWNGTGSNFGSTQGAAFTFATAPTGLLVPNSLILKASGGSTNNPSNYIRVGYVTLLNQVWVSTTTNGNNFLPSYTTRGTMAATFASGDTLTARANADGSVDVWKTTAANVTTYLGHVAIPTSGGGSWSQGTGGGRIGLLLPNNARVDNFRGGNLSAVIVAAGMLALDDVMAQPNKVFLSLLANPTPITEAVQAAEAAQAEQADGTQAGTQDDAIQRPYAILLPYVSNQ